MACSVVQRRHSELSLLLLLAVEPVAVGLVFDCTPDIHPHSEREVVASLRNLTAQGIHHCPDTAQMIRHVEHRSAVRNKPSSLEQDTLQRDLTIGLPVYQRTPVQKPVPIIIQRTELRAVCKIGIIRNKSAA